MALYEVPLKAIVTFEEFGSRDLEARMAMLRTAMEKVTAYVQEHFSVSLDWELGAPEVIVPTTPVHFDDEDAEDAAAKAPPLGPSERRRRSKSA